MTEKPQDSFSAAAKSIARHVPGAKRIHESFLSWRSQRDFSTSGDYWERRYTNGGNSGAGSYGQLAEHKAEVLNEFVSDHDIHNVIELGVGDGHQLSLARYPSYVGFDVSSEAVRICRERFADDATKRFLLLDDYTEDRAELTLSLDVIYHLVEDDVFDAHMRLLFDSSTRYVAIYASNYESKTSTAHVRHREFTRWIGEHRPDWTLERCIKNPFPYDPTDNGGGSFADFYFYESPPKGRPENTGESG
ncbi:class I SAM-dependent methyltransferase [Rathayibacter sp. CAU 1779]